MILPWWSADLSLECPYHSSLFSLPPLPFSIPRVSPGLYLIRHLTSTFIFDAPNRDTVHFGEIPSIQKIRRWEDTKCQRVVTFWHFNFSVLRIIKGLWRAGLLWSTSTTLSSACSMGIFSPSI